jgi:aspartate/methionine/tyrosine aminotransferase
MAYPINDAVAATMAPPISDAFSWIPSYGGKDSFINLSQAVPGYPPADALVGRIAELAHEPGRHLYTDILGLPTLRARFAAGLRRDYGGDVDVQDVAITAGCNQAFCLAIAALARPGDNVILPLPYFFNHHMWLAMQGIEPRLFESAGARPMRSVPRPSSTSAPAPSCWCRRTIRPASCAQPTPYWRSTRWPSAAASRW